VPTAGTLPTYGAGVLRRCRSWAQALTAAAVVALFAPACGGAPSSAAAPPPFEQFGTVSVTVVLADGSRREWCLLLADTPQRRARGLMEVGSLAGFDGMAFRFGSPVEARFYMFATRLPLSIAFLAGDGAVVSTADMDPCPASDPAACPLTSSAARYTDAVEVLRGELTLLGFVDGARATFGSACRPRR
jgi:hypothetical protein